jgi:hypothetical protein
MPSKTPAKNPAKKDVKFKCQFKDCPSKGLSNMRSLRKHFKNVHKIKDVKLMEETIKQIIPDYKP